MNCSTVLEKMVVYIKLTGSNILYLCFKFTILLCRHNILSLRKIINSEIVFNCLTAMRWRWI